MRRPCARLLAALLLFGASLPSLGSGGEQMIFGSFRSQENAQNWAKRLTQLFGTPIKSEAREIEGARWYRVQTEPMASAAADLSARKSDASGISYWRNNNPVPAGRVAGEQQRLTAPPGINPPTSSTSVPQESANQESERVAPDLDGTDEEVAQTKVEIRSGGDVSQDSVTRKSARDRSRQSSDWDIGLQSRVFADEGFAGQGRVEGSISIELDHFRTWDNDRKQLTVTPFVRFDSRDDERSHFDLRDLYWTRVGESWDLHVGVKRVFWGVTEFHHLVDIVNQTDLVENIDGEDKLGQPMVQVSLVRDWGILDVFALTGFRERTFPSMDGRLRGPFEVTDDALYESGAEEYRTDFAVRWSNQVGPFEVGVHHFSGTSRDPMFMSRSIPGPAGLELVPYYPVIDQSGIDALAITGDWSVKFEGMSRSGFGERYGAFNFGVERTLVGVFDTNVDLGIVAEYMFDERDEDAFDTLFEHDVAIGGRFALNDFADTQALVGVIADTESSDLVLSIEASRQLGPNWAVTLEGRLFQGGRSPQRALLAPNRFAAEYKSAWLQEDDYVQIEFKKFL
ncbi:MAG: hypothetical protein GKR90_04170 [Pseudomonadales bacterium]|nr:hypothetical protein [Pseudomonadales bacterium]